MLNYLSKSVYYRSIIVTLQLDTIIHMFHSMQAEFMYHIKMKLGTVMHTIMCIYLQVSCSVEGDTHYRWCQHWHH